MGMVSIWGKAGQVMLDLIYDRTEEDVRRGRDKGFYRHTDLNRVQNAAEAVRARFGRAGYDGIPAPSPAFTVWRENDIPTFSRAAGILRAVRAFAGLVPLADAPGLADEVPSSPDLLDWRGANAVEAFLYLLDDSLGRIEAAWIECGEGFSGEAEG